MAEIGQSTQYSARVNPATDRGYATRLYFSYTHAGSNAQGEIPLLKLPAGNFRVYPVASRVVTSAMATSSHISIGHQAYEKPDGSTVSAAPTKWMNQQAVGASPVDAALVGNPEVVSSKNGVVLEAKIGGGNIETGDTIQGWVDLVRA